MVRHPINTAVGIKDGLTFIAENPDLAVAAAEKTWNTFETGDSVIRAGMFGKAAGYLTAGAITGAGVLRGAKALSGDAKLGRETENVELFTNQFPNHAIERPNLIPHSQIKNISGRFNYVVTKEGELIIGKKGRIPGRGHIDLVNGQPVRAAGEVSVVKGEIKYLDNSSGHYLPRGASAQESAEQAFNKLDLNTADKYIEKIWIEDLSMQNRGTWRALK